MRLQGRAVAGMVLSGLVLAPLTAPAATKPIERFTAVAVDTSGFRTRTRVSTLDIAIERWSTDAERDHLYAALKEKGPHGLLSALHKSDEVGWVSSAGSLGLRLRFAHQYVQPDGTRRILIGTDRPIRFVETWNGLRTTDYPFVILDIRLGPDGQGEGKLLPLARIEADGDHVVEIENYANEPVRLTRVEKVG
jgi:hypothetical protein